MDYTDIDQAIRQGTARQSVPGQVVEVLTDLVWGDGHRTITATRHPLGFLCLPIQRAGDYGICVHVWTTGLPQARPTTSAAHSHSWDLRSFVLYGRVRNELLHVTDEPRAPTHRVFEVHSRPDVDEIRATSRLVRWAGSAAETSGAGDTYDLPAGRFHMTVIEGGQEAATVALGRTRRGSVDLSLGSLQTRTHQVRRQPCDPAETILAARTVLRRLAATRMT